MVQLRCHPKPASTIGKTRQFAHFQLISLNKLQRRGKAFIGMSG
jgi:hypothetical protein